MRVGHHMHRECVSAYGENVVAEEREAWAIGQQHHPELWIVQLVWGAHVTIIRAYQTNTNKHTYTLPIIRTSHPGVDRDAPAPQSFAVWQR